MGREGHLETIRVTEEAGVRRITLNRPERRNALTPEMQGGLIAAFEDAEADPGCRVVVLAGAGDEAFCAGLDLASLQGMNDQSEAEHAADAKRISRMFRTVYSLGKPTIAAVKGFAVAGGTGLATMCDFTIAAAGSKFGYTEARVGFVPAMVSAYLVLQVGEKRARDLLLTGRIFGAEEGVRLGLVTEMVPVDGLEGRVEELAKGLVANSPESMRATKALLEEQSRAWLDRALEASMKANAEARKTHDFKEGVAAFLEKRKPVWG
jgi:methylglutaconyl-CoA hydratase